MLSLGEEGRFSERGTFERSPEPRDNSSPWRSWDQGHPMQDLPCITGAGLTLPARWPRSPRWSTETGSYYGSGKRASPRRIAALLSTGKRAGSSARGGEGPCVFEMQKSHFGEGEKQIF